MIAFAILLLIAILGAYGWVAYKVKTTPPKMDVTVPKPLASKVGD